MEVGKAPMDRWRASEIVLAWLNKVPLEAELDDDAMSRVERPLDADEIRQAFRTLATAPETTTEEFGGFVAGNYRMFVAQTERLSAKEAAKRARSDLDAWFAEAEARRSAARSIWNILMDLSPYLVIAGIILAVHAGYSFLASRVVDERLLPPTNGNVLLTDIAVIGISFVLTIAGFGIAGRKDTLSWWAWAALVFGVPWAVALTLHVAFT